MAIPLTLALFEGLQHECNEQKISKVPVFCAFT